MSVVICIGRLSIDKVASGEPCDVGQGVTLIAADDLFHASPYAEIEALKTKLAKAGKYLQEICDHGNDWGGTACSAHAFLALGNAIHPN